MENQVNVGDQNTQPVGQNPITQSFQSSEKPKINYLVIGLVILICFVMFGFGGYYLGKQFSVTQNIDINQPQSTLGPSIATDPIASWKTFTDKKYNFQIKLPKYYNVPNTGLWSMLAGSDLSSIDPQQDATLEESSLFDKTGERYLKSILLESLNVRSLDDWRKNSKFSSSHKFITEEINDNVFMFTTLALGLTGYVDNDRLTGFAAFKENRVIVVALRHYTANQSEVKLFIDQILSTFKFVN